MPTIKQTTIYTFDELSDTAKDRARDWFRSLSAGDSDFAESVVENASECADMLGINLRTDAVKLMGGGTRQSPRIYWSGFSSQGDGACFEGDYSYRKGSVQAIGNEWPSTFKHADGTVHESKSNAELNRIARELTAIQRRHFYKITAQVSHTGRYSHEHSTTIAVFIDDRDADDDTVEIVADLLRDFMRWIYRSLETEYEYQNSDEVIDETIRANEYTFDVNGNRE